MSETHGLCKARSRTCPCGVVFEARKPNARYCSLDCRLKYTRYGRSYGQHEPTPLKVWRS
jgi:hypothetical protein